MVPIPEHSYKSRAPIKKESLEFIEVGSTRKEEVVLNLGPANYTRENERVFVYHWFTESRWELITLHGGGSNVSRKYYEFLIEFDDIDIVKGFGMKGEKGEYTEK